MNRAACFALTTSVLAMASPAAAWGDLGHEVTARIAYHPLTPAAKSKVDALLARDTDTLTAPDIARRATYRRTNSAMAIAKRRHGTSLMLRSINPT